MNRVRHDPEGRITLRKNPRRVRVYAGDMLVADSSDAIELRETGYPARQYLPREDIAMQYLKQTDKTTYCPYKGDTRYFSIMLAHGTIENAAWCYPDPFPAMAAIKGRIAFDAARVEERTGD